MVESEDMTGRLGVVGHRDSSSRLLALVVRTRTPTGAVLRTELIDTCPADVLPDINDRDLARLALWAFPGETSFELHRSSPRLCFLVIDRPARVGKVTEGVMVRKDVTYASRSVEYV